MKKSYLLVVALFAFSCFHVSGQVLNDTTITVGTISSFTRTVPVTLTYEVTIRAFGGGGGGASPADPNDAAGGGGGGAYSEVVDLEIPAGDYEITVGVGGGPGVAGGSTIFKEAGSGGTEFVVAEGGFPGSESSGGNGGRDSEGEGSTTESGGSGGVSGNCAPANPNLGGGGGGAGSNATSGDDGGDGDCMTGLGGGGGTGAPSAGTVDGGDGGDGGNGGSAGGGNASSPGGGGGGKAQGLAFSGNGAAGRIEIVITAILPIELISFEGEVLKNTVELTWTTASEVNNDFVAIERSEDAVNFVEIGRIPGQGDTEEERSYSFVDKAPMPGLNYYRLRQVDFNGDENRHAIIAIDVEIEQVPSAMNIYPNPTQDMLQVEWELPLRRSASLELYDMTGKLLKREKISPLSATHQLSTANLPTGLYLLHFTSGDQVEVKRFEKE